MLTTKDKTLIKSQFIQIVKSKDKAIIWHSLFGNPKIVSTEILSFLDVFSSPHQLNSVLDEYKCDKNSRKAIQDLIESYYLIPRYFDERKFLAKHMKGREKFINDGSLINYLELIMSEACNFRCSYCVHFNNLEMSDRVKNPKKFMNFEIAKETIEKYLKILRKHSKKIAEINFGGGEPILAWEVIEQVLEYCQLNYGREFDFCFSINTNASLITPKIAEKLKEYNVEIASSLDGLRDGNDLVRLTKSGGGTFEIITQGFENLAEKGYPMKGIAVTINDWNFQFIDEKIIDWANDRDMKEVRIDIDIIGMVQTPIKNIVGKLMYLRQYAKNLDIEIAGFWSRPAENLNDSTLDSHVAFCGMVRGNNMCVSPSGDIYGCGYSATRLGTISQIESFCASDSRYSNFVREHLTGTMKMCKGCMIEGQCGGGCVITQEFSRATNTAKIERMCDFYRQMTCELLTEQLREIDTETALA
ncbi:MAG: arylsulfatase regulator (Fe-S oxidoreductase) [Parcubacteria group bacterium GW2011_GWA1_40_21]|nr:MAG: arylsulfatase regulator (Fe-S oxidoreductase) [Parcubacteria group bacterium GW2011_GWC1_40_13]KKR53630.1 MAG: arylsulfatase regulator (Fe-S oxidoreductase) [Parcubacteria group bacterium GW2011_GWA1_40_21]